MTGGTATDLVAALRAEPAAEAEPAILPEAPPSFPEPPDEFDQLLEDRAGRLHWTNPVPGGRYNLVAIGGGTAGAPAAIAAARQGRAADHAIGVVSLLGLSVPNFALGPLLGGVLTDRAGFRPAMLTLAALTPARLPMRTAAARMPSQSW